MSDKKAQRERPFGYSAEDYLDVGFWPIPVKGKAYPEPGTTGITGEVTRKLVKRLIAKPSRQARNVALRHVDTMALDVDGHDHDGKHGDVVLADRIKRWGKLPATWSSTARGDDSATRQYFYRIPEGHLLVSQVPLTKKDHKRGLTTTDIEVIHHGHRYSVVWPSVHPDTDEQYRWYDPSGKRSKLPPHIDELPDLPDAWLEALTPEVYEAPGTNVELFDYDKLTAGDNERLTQWMTSAIDGVIADLTELTEKATARPEDYKGPAWDETVFRKAVRLAELAKAPWSPLTLDDAQAILLEHAPRDKGFDDRRVLEKWASAVRKSTDAIPLPITPGNPSKALAYTLPFDIGVERATRVDPDSFFQKPEGLLTQKIADHVAYDLAVGPDGAIWLYEAGVWVRRDDEIERRLARLLGNRHRMAYVPNVRSGVIYGRDLPRIGFEPNARLINVRNGMVDWRTGELEPHDPELLSTVQLPVEYVPGAECSTFDAWLAQVVPADSIQLVWEALGYLLMSGNPLQKAVLLVGPGGNGKGTLLRVLTHVIGKHNTASLTLDDITDGKFELAGTFGKLANIAGDLESKALTKTAKFKQFTGGDSMLVQHKYGHPFEFTPWAVPIFSANEMWQSSDNTDGYLRRWLPLPFPNKLSHDPSFSEAALMAEASGIFNRALTALRVLMSRGDFEVVGQAADLKRRFELEANTVKLWLANDEHVKHSEAGNDTIRTVRTHLYKVYETWSSTNGYQPLNAGNFYKRLEHIGHALLMSKGTRYILGIAVDSMPMGAASMLQYTPSEPDDD